MKDYFQLIRSIMLHGSEVRTRGVLVKELLAQQLLIKDWNYYSCESRPLDKTSTYLWGELAWYFSGDRRAELIVPYSKFWAGITNPDGTLNSNYGHLVFYKSRSNFTPFDWALHSLIKEKHSRQAIILYNDREYMIDGIKDYICSQYQHFLIRDDVLICVVGLRSSDAIFGLTYNMPWWSLVHQQLHLSLLHKYHNLKLGEILVNISSAHIYENHFELVEGILSDGVHPKRHFVTLKETVPIGLPFEYYKGNIQKFVEINDQMPKV